MSRIQTVFQRLQADGRKALIPFVTAGFPTPELTLPLMHALVDGGADIIELGVPFSDPMADGPTIQRASERALAQGMSLRKVLETVRAFRVTNPDTPVVLMGYANPIEAMGLERFAAAAAQAGGWTSAPSGASPAVRARCSPSWTASPRSICTRPWVAAGWSRTRQSTRSRCRRVKEDRPR